MSSYQVGGKAPSRPPPAGFSVPVVSAPPGRPRRASPGRVGLPLLPSGSPGSARRAASRLPAVPPHLRPHVASALSSVCAASVARPLSVPPRPRLFGEAALWPRRRRSAARSGGAGGRRPPGRFGVRPASSLGLRRGRGWPWVRCLCRAGAFE